MLEKNELSFIFLWVINPIVILFYQNCASIPQEHTEIKTSAPTHMQSSYKAPACRQGDCVEPIN